MADATPFAPGRIFLSYRRDETAYPAGWLYDRLAAHFGDATIFKDVASIEPGDDFVEAMTTAVGACAVLLAVIGRQWLTLTDEHGRHRLDDPADYVRLEIEAALARDVLVIPVLVDGAAMPRAEDLPDSLAPLVRRQAVEVSPARFDFDIGRLIKVLERTLAEPPPSPEPEPEPRPGPGPALAPVLMIRTAGSPKARYRAPSQDLLRQLVAELSLPGRGNGFLVAERADQPDGYVQVARDGANDYLVEHRAGPGAAHLTAGPLSRAEARSRLVSWAFDPAHWPGRFGWQTRGAPYLARRQPGRARNRDGAWVPVATADSGSRHPVAPTHAIRQTDALPPQMRRWAGVVVAGAAAVALAVVVLQGGDDNRGGRTTTSIAPLTTATVPLPTTIPPTTSTTDPQPLFRDDFSGLGMLLGDGVTTGGVHRFALTSGGSASSYALISDHLPDHVAVAVTARTTTSLTDGTTYGVLCRFDFGQNHSYPLVVADGKVHIDKVVGEKFRRLASAPTAVDTTVPHRIEASCTTLPGQGGVLLELRIDGELLVTAVDTDDPLLTGTIGLHATSADGDDLDVAFDDLEVSRATPPAEP